jgi:GrpB-like predicted nucleotidyltransferase (UPF0157 family)
VVIGLEHGVVRLAPYTPRWAELYAEEAARIRALLGDELLEIEHIGSTAIAGMEAKPILDIGAAVRSFEAGSRCVGPLERLGYRYMGEYGIPGRHYFVKGSPRTHHLHMVAIDSEEWRINLVFRDALRASPELAERYRDLKRRLAAEFENDRVGYTEGKAEFIRSVLRRASGSPEP